MTININGFNIKRKIKLCKQQTCLPSTGTNLASTTQYKMLSCRRETELQDTLILAEKWKTGTGRQYLRHYKSIVNHGDVIGQHSNRIRWRMQNKGYYAVQHHSMSWRSVSIKCPYVTWNQWLISQIFWIVGASPFSHVRRPNPYPNPNRNLTLTQC